MYYKNCDDSVWTERTETPFEVICFTNGLVGFCFTPDW